ncbi:disulfide bond formation protein B [Brevundimonas sp.]|uniref:disulfide bond formation protein B n=1 Tax=Brevundimonas sp. TaxID=1871086 RepID=UPI003D6D4ED3
MSRLYLLLTRWWTAFALAASLAMLAAAHAFERFGGMDPCNLCLKQREVYWAAVAIAGAATFWAVLSRASRGTPRIASFLLAAVFFTGAITAGFHAGGELKWWALPATCMAGNPADFSLEGLNALAAGTAEIKPIVGCDAVSWSLFGISMAGWNFFISLALAVFSLLAAKRPKDARAPRG